MNTTFAIKIVCEQFITECCKQKSNTLYGCCFDEMCNQILY